MTTLKIIIDNNEVKIKEGDRDILIRIIEAFEDKNSSWIKR